MTLSRFNIPLILAITDKATVQLWDDETFRYITKGPSFKQVQDVIGEFEIANEHIRAINDYKEGRCKLV